MPVLRTSSQTSVQRLGKSCKPRLDVSRAASCRDQALLAFAARLWCPEVGLAASLFHEPSIEEENPHLPCWLLGGPRVAAGWCWCEHAPTEPRLGRHTHADVDAGSSVPVRACLPSHTQTCSYLLSFGAVLTRAAPRTLLCSQTRRRRSHGAGLFLGALRRILSVVQMLES